MAQKFNSNYILWFVYIMKAKICTDYNFTEAHVIEVCFVQEPKMALIASDQYIS